MSNTDFWVCCNTTPRVGVFGPEFVSPSTSVVACAAGAFFERKEPLVHSPRLSLDPVLDNVASSLINGVVV